jgi:hypothetical protein
MGMPCLSLYIALNFFLISSVGSTSKVIVSPVKVLINSASFGIGIGIGIIVIITMAAFNYQDIDTRFDGAILDFKNGEFIEEDQTIMNNNGVEIMK